MSDTPPTTLPTPAVRPAHDILHDVIGRKAVEAPDATMPLWLVVSLLEVAYTAGISAGALAVLPVPRATPEVPEKKRRKLSPETRKAMSDRRKDYLARKRAEKAAAAGTLLPVAEKGEPAHAGDEFREPQA